MARRYWIELCERVAAGLGLAGLAAAILAFARQFHAARVSGPLLSISQ